MYHAVRMSLNISSDEEDLAEFIIPKSDEYLGSNVGKKTYSAEIQQRAKERRIEQGFQFSFWANKNFHTITGIYHKQCKKNINDKGYISSGE